MRNNKLGNKIGKIEYVIRYQKLLNMLGLGTYRIAGLPSHISEDNVNTWLWQYGRLVAFRDDITSNIEILPYNSIVYGRYGEPSRCIAYSPFLENFEYTITSSTPKVFLYDNTSHESLQPIIYQYAKELARIRRISEINILHQKTPRLWNCPPNQEVSLRHILEDYKDDVEMINTYKDLAVDEITATLTPAPFVADKINLYFKELWSEVLSVLGVTSTNINKRERVTHDEIIQSNGGTLVFAANRYNTRYCSIKEMNALFGINCEIVTGENINVGGLEYEEIQST